MSVIYLYWCCIHTLVLYTHIGVIYIYWCYIWCYIHILVLYRCCIQIWVLYTYIGDIYTCWCYVWCYIHILVLYVVLHAYAGVVFGVIYIYWCCIHILVLYTHIGLVYIYAYHMGWLRLVGSLQLQVSFAEYSLFYRALLQKRPIILRSLLIVATPYHVDMRLYMYTTPTATNALFFCGCTFVTTNV